MFSHSGARSAPVSSTRLALPWQPSAVLKRLQLFAANAVWWVLSIGIVVAVWEGAAALQLIDPLILPPPHLFIAEIQQQAQFLLPRIGVQRVGANFVALTAIMASLQRVLIGLLLAFIASLLIGSLAFYIDVFGKLMLPAVTLLAPIAPVAWIPFALVAFGIGDGAAIFVVFIGIVFTLTLGTVHHMTHVDQVYINSARVLGRQPTSGHVPCDSPRHSAQSLCHHAHELLRGLDGCPGGRDGGGEHGAGHHRHGRTSDDEYELDVSWHGDDRAGGLSPGCRLSCASDARPLVEEQRAAVSACLQPALG